MRVAAASADALRLGLAPGLALADARARVLGLVVIGHDPDADLRLLDRLADGCERYTPMTAIDPPDGLILDVTGCAHLFMGGEAEIAADLLARLSRQGLSARFACATTPDAAIALARFGGREGEAEALPIEALAMAEEVHRALGLAGLRTIGELAERSRGALAARFGAELPVRLDRLLGAQDGRVSPRREPPALVVETRFAEPIARDEHVLGAIDHLAGEAEERLTERGGGGRRFALALFRSDGHVARLAIETALPTREPAVLARLFRERIDSLADPLDPGFGYDLIRLAVPRIDPIAPAQLELEGGSVAEEQIAVLLDRLATRLGRGRVHRFQSRDTHIPEQAAFELPVADRAGSASWPTADPGEPPTRPIHLFDPPHRIEVTADAPDGPPRGFRWRRALHEVMRCEGPERIAAEWWRRRDNAGLTRDYYRVEDARGRRFWLFRHGLPESETADPAWYLHGLFA